MKRSHRVFLIGFALFLLLGFRSLQSSLAQEPPPDPEMGPLAVLSGEDERGDQTWMPPDFGVLVEVRSKFYYPDNIGQLGPLPIVVLLHGQHNTCMNQNPPSPYPQTVLTWPCDTLPGSGWSPIPSYRGYDYLAQLIASYGYIVVSVSANGINANDVGQDLDGFARGATARANLVNHHLDMWNGYNTTNDVPQDPNNPLPAGFFRGKVNMQNIGLMGHSRGGEGVAYLAARGTRTGINAVLALAPTDFSRLRINSGLFSKPALGVLLPYCDGDVSDLSGVHYYDDARYNLLFEAPDPRPKHTFLMMGANHNYFNVNWSGGTVPSGSPTPLPGGGDDWTRYGVGTPIPPRIADINCGTGTGNGRLTQESQRSAGRAYISAFFRVYLGGETRLHSLLVANQPVETPVPVATVYASYHAANNQDMKKDVNRLTTSSSLNTNDLGGSVTGSSLNPYLRCGGDSSSSTRHCLPAEAPPQYGLPYYEPRQPHTSDGVGIPKPPAPSPTMRPGLSQLSVGWSGATGDFTNEIPTGSGSVALYEALQFRVAVNFRDTRNPDGQTQGFNVILTSGSNPAQTSLVTIDNAYQSRPNPLFYPPGSKDFLWPHPVPHEILNTVRIRLTNFMTNNPNLNLADIRSVKFNFGQHQQGALLISDIAFTNSLCAAPLPLPTPTSCPLTNYRNTDAIATATIVPGDPTPVLTNCDDCQTPIALPFPYSFYEQTYNTAIVGDNGTLGFSGNSNPFIHTHLPAATFNYAILPYWGSLYLTNHQPGGFGCPTSSPCGIYTSTSGQAPNRIFNIEWRACQYDPNNPNAEKDAVEGAFPCGQGGTGPVKFEVRLYEGIRQFDVVYGPLTFNGYGTTIGVQRGTASGGYYTEAGYNRQLQGVTRISFTQPPCKLNPCPIKFQDTPDNSAFASYTSCLSCRGIINGYPCGGPGEPCVCPTSNQYFRPGGNVTRGQLSKMASISAGFGETPLSQTFEDVPPSYTFYVWIERLASRGYIGGYLCGGPGEPCQPGNRAYFRPANNVTRGQLSKIVSNSAGYSDPPGAQRYEDVPPGSTFYDWVQRLTNRNIMGGYLCGGPGEPCGPGNLPYFRPNNTATRGQASKIIGNSFFTDCSPSNEIPAPVPTSAIDAPPPVPTP